MPPSMRTLLLLSLVAPWACSADDVSGEAPSVRLHAEWLGSSPADTLPAGVASLRVVINVSGSDPTDLIRSVDSLVDSDGNGRPELILPSLPAWIPVRIDVEGHTEDDAVRWVGSTGNLTLGVGQRVHVDIKMYETGAPFTVDAAVLPGRLFHTATALRDGRLLIAGGFTSATPSASCPDGASSCFDLVATNEAFLFDPVTGTVRKLATPMLQARGGHTASVLPDGRVLIAGGAPRTRLSLFAQGSAGFVPSLEPLGPMGATPAAWASFELFDPEANPETEDVDGDGDRFRGGFVGGAPDPTKPGVLAMGRAFHGAASVDANGDFRVVLAGGTPDAAASSVEVFDAHRAGGYGVLPNILSMHTARILPGVVALAVASGREVWIVGGAITPRSDADLAEIWRPRGTDASGSLAPTPASFPGGMSPEGRPELSLIAPAMATYDGGKRAIVVGWFGPRCMPGVTSPVYPSDDTMPYTVCDPEQSGDRPRSFAIDGIGGTTSPLSLSGAHAFAGAATLASGRPVVTGGIANLVFSATPTVELFEQTPGPTGAPGRVTSSFTLRAPRAFHTSTALPNGLLVTTGGANIMPDGRAITLTGGAEIVLLQ